MSGDSPFVVVVASADSRVGQSTLAENLAVYLKGLLEDLPVALLSFDPAQDPAQTFSFSGCRYASLAQLFDGRRLEDQLGLGQFGVQFLTAGRLPEFSPEQLRRLLNKSHFPGILIIDAGPLNRSSALSSLQAADLVLTPLRDAQGLAAVAKIRQALKQGGGDDRMLWLLPSMVDDPRQQARQLELLRFAAAERGCQVLDLEFVRDELLPESTRGQGGTVLTRLPGGRSHQLFTSIAQMLLRQFEQGFDSGCRLQRLRSDGELPGRSRLIEMICPLCARLVWQASAHYAESLPQRRRWLMHADCLSSLMGQNSLQPFWSSRSSLVLRTGIEGAGLVPQLKLLLPADDFTLLDAELFQPAQESAWQLLVRYATGRRLAEQLPALIMVYPAILAEQALGDGWYRECVRLRRGLREGLAPEL